MRLSELRRQVAKVRTTVRNPREVERLHQVMEQIQRLEKEWDHIEALKKGPRPPG
jgi:rRNA pseudouridine-1189 N-methylase Emg1 (Nep1/Mra1 family)